MVVLSIVMQQKYLFLFCFEVVEDAAMLVPALPVTSRKGWLMTCYILFPHMPALIMTSQTHTARHKLAELTAVFSRLWKVVYRTNLTLNQLVLSGYVLYYSMS